MPTIKRRRDAAVASLESIAPHVDVIWLWLDGHDDAEADAAEDEFTFHLAKHDVELRFSNGERGPAGRYFPVAMDWLSLDAYLFTCDDDIWYPPDYVPSMIATLDALDRPAVVSLRGDRLPPVCRHYRKDRTLVQGWFSGPRVEEPTRIHIPGCGVSLTHPSTLVGLSLEFMTKVPKTDDIHMGRFCQEKGVEVWLHPRPVKRWCKMLVRATEYSICNEKESTGYQNQATALALWRPLPALAKCREPHPTTPEA